MNSPVSFHGRYLSLVRQIEQTYRVTEWRYGDVEIWPLARMDLYLDMFWQEAKSSPPLERKFPFRLGSCLARSLINRWRSRTDLVHYEAHPRRAGAVFLGDGVSLDRIDGAWQDRFGEPLLAAFERRQTETFVMQSGNLNRLPWKRRTFAANRIEAAGWLKSQRYRLPLELPDHADVLHLLAKDGCWAPSLRRAALAKRARLLCGTAAEFERLLGIIEPSLAFVVTYYAGLGPAFALACRRLRILCVDLQHCPQDGAHKAYTWFALPPGGYKTLPAVFWNWTVRDCDNIQSWAGRLVHPWHRGFHGGHLQIGRFINDAKEYRSTPPEGGADQREHFEREILVALQPIPGHRHIWDALTTQIEHSPLTWRWWIRRHPASLRRQDAEFGRLLSLQRTNIVIDAASDVTLPALLERIDVVLSLASGASAEAAMFGVPALFLSSAASDYFADMIARNEARIIEISNTIPEIARIQARKKGTLPTASSDDLDVSLLRLRAIAVEYAGLCRTHCHPNALQQRLQPGSSPPLHRRVRRNPASFS